MKVRKVRWKRSLSLLLAVSLLISLLPGFAVLADSTKYGMVTGEKKVNVRKSASTGDDAWFQLEPGTVVEVRGTTKSGGKTWYLVTAEHPDPGSTRMYKGAILGDFFRMLTDAEEADYKAGKLNTPAPAAPTSTPTAPSTNTPAPTSTPTPAGGNNNSGGSGTRTIGKVNAGNTNFRQKPDTGSPYIEKLARNAEVEILSGPDNGWYKVEYKGNTGYIMSKYVNVAGTATATPAPVESGDYVRLIKTSCHLRKTPGGQYDRDWEGYGQTLPMYGTAVTQNGYVWYPVMYGGVRYYVRNDCVAVTGSSSGQPSNPTSTPTPAGSPIGNLKTVKGGVNFRSAVDNTGRVFFQVKKGVTMPYYQGPMRINGYDWYYAYTGNTFGYIRSDCVKVVTDAPASTPTPTSGTSTATPTAVPTATPTPVKAVLYVTTYKTGCNLRNEPSGKNVLTQIGKGVTLPVISQPVTKGGYEWYQVQYNGRTGWLRDDVVHETESDGSNTPAPTATPTPGPTATPEPQSLTKFLKTTTDKVNLRSAPSKSSPALAQVALGTVLAYSATHKVGSSTWYQVRYNGQNCWVLGEMGSILTVKEYNDYIASKPSKTPEPVTEIVGYVKTTSGGLNLRNSCDSSSTIVGRADKGVVMPYLCDPITANGHVWYFVDHPKLGKVYVLSEFVTVCDKNGKNTPTPVPVTPIPGAKEADYDVLLLGSSGTAVKNLVTELKNKGYYTDVITSTFNTKVEEAVKAFQKVQKMTQDGIATADVQHALFGTVPYSGSVQKNGMTLYPAEKIDWFTGGIQTLWPKGTTYKIYDVKTGLVWQAYRWSGFNHVDAEPLTASDTAILCKMYGVSNAQQIADKDLWQRRPSLVTIKGHTYACSLYGEPHNEDGNTIKNNNFPGQLCIHFTNSKTSDTKKVNAQHQEAIQYAWEHCPAGHK